MKFVFVLIIGLASTATAQNAMPSDANEVVKELEEKQARLKARYEKAQEALKSAAVRKLRPIESRYKKDAKKAEATLVAKAIREIMAGSLTRATTSFTSADIGKKHVMQVTAAVGGTVWGTGPYTADSNLAALVIHAGILKPGETGLVEVEVIKGQESFDGAESYGVKSEPYGPWDVGIVVSSL